MDQRPQGTEPIRVILAEDHGLVREGTRRILEATDNIRVVGEAAVGEAAAEAVDRHDPNLDVS